MSREIRDHSDRVTRCEEKEKARERERERERDKEKRERKKPDRNREISRRHKRCASIDNWQNDARVLERRSADRAPIVASARVQQIRGAPENRKREKKDM